MRMAAVAGCNISATHSTYRDMHVLSTRLDQSIISCTFNLISQGAAIGVEA